MEAKRFLNTMETSTSEGSQVLDLTVRPKESKYPFCLVWTPIPLITWILPFVGHLGIADSTGKIYDFAGPYFINTGELAFGRTSRYIQLITIKDATPDFAKNYDRAISSWNCVYTKRMHNLFWDNCHSHCKNILNDLKYKNFTNWNMAILAMWMFVSGKLVRPVYSFLPSILLYSLVIIPIVLL